MISFTLTVKSSQVMRSFGLLDPHSRKVCIRNMVLLCLISGLDLIGIVIIGAITSIAIRGIASSDSGDKVQQLEEILHLNNLSVQQKVSVLGVIACLLFLSKSVISIKVSRSTLGLLGKQAALVTTKTLNLILKSPLESLRRESKAGTIYNLTLGINAIIIGIIGTSISLVADFFFLFVVGIGLLSLDPIMAILTFTIFVFIGLGLYFILHRRAVTLGEQSSKLNISSNNLISDTLTLSREIRVHSKVDEFTDNVFQTRKALSSISAEISFMPNISKYVLENAIVVSALAIAGFEFWLKDASNAAATLAIFLVAGTRLAPAVMRIQQGAIGIRSHKGTANATLETIEILTKEDRFCSCVEANERQFCPEIRMNNVSFLFPHASQATLKNIDLEINEGEMVAIIGASGAGKSTLLDIMLGFRFPNDGLTFISGCCPSCAIKNWPGKISVVPQNAGILSGSIAENVALATNLTPINFTKITEVLEIAQLTDFVASLPNGIHERLEEEGGNISGGQRQRIALARALYSDPQILILDEATSALDSETEELIANAVNSLKGSVTVVQVAHRLSSVKSADKIIYLENGQVLGSGTMEELRSRIPKFETQASLFGL